MLDDIVAGEGIASDRLLLKVVVHGLAMIVAGIADDDLPIPTQEAASARRPREGENQAEDCDDDIRF